MWSSIDVHVTSLDEVAPHPSALCAMLAGLLLAGLQTRAELETLGFLNG